MVPFAFWVLLKRGKHHRGTRFLLAWFLSTFTALSLTSSKQEHYVTLLLPSTALLLGYFAHFGFSRKPRWERTFVTRYVLVLLFLLAAVGVFSLIMPLLNFVGWTIFQVVAGLAIIAACLWVLLCKKDVASQFMVVIVSMVVAVATYALVIYRAYDGKNVVPQFVKQATPYLAKADKIYVTGSHPAAFEYYMHRRLVNETNLLEAYHKATPADVVVVSGDGDKLNTAVIPETPIIDIKKRHIRAVLYVKPSRQNP